MSLVISSNRLVFIYFTILLISLSIPLVYYTALLYTSSIWQAVTTRSIIQATSIMSNSSHIRTPVDFLGISGPNFMENIEHPAYTKLTAVGLEITAQVKPKAVVVLSTY